MTVADLSGLVPYDEDIEERELHAPSLTALAAAVAEADALLIATPEYNQSIPGVLKNAIDWLSRPRPGRLLVDKPVAIMGATPGAWGTRYAQRELRHVLTACGSLVLPTPQLYIAHVGSAIVAGELVDEETRAALAELVEGLVEWTSRVAPSSQLVSSV